MTEDGLKETNDRGWPERNKWQWMTWKKRK